ncbi:MAG: stage II sporulation protein M [Verrucomicrobiota bacterium]
MIVDFDKFVEQEQVYWQELEGMLDKSDKDIGFKMSLAEIQRFQYLYGRVSSDLAKVSVLPSESDIRVYLEGLVARTYSFVHEVRVSKRRFKIVSWIKDKVPSVFRTRVRSFQLSCTFMFIGALFGALAIIWDPASKEIIMPFPHLLGDPSDRVAYEEANKNSETMAGSQGTFASSLMTHNIKVSLFVFALGITAGIGPSILLFYNGVILGAVFADYMIAEETLFLLAWLLPHGSVELPAVLIAGQASYVLAGAIIGREDGKPLTTRIRQVLDDLMHLLGCVAILLIWAGVVESFFSQYHYPVLPYEFKIIFGAIQLVALFYWLLASRRKSEQST